jgi:tetratricopeptide (TPR) repeat protein
MSSSHQAGETALDRGRAFYQGRAWADAFHALSEANGITPLAPADLQLLALSAALTGHDDQFLSTLERLHSLYLEEGAFAAAARAAFWLGFRLMSLGEMGQSAGWLSRVQRLVEREGRECAAQGFLLLTVAFRAIAGGDLAAAYQTAVQAAAIGERCHDRDLEAFARQQQGRVLLRQGRLAQGLALLDEAMVAAKAGEVSPVMTWTWPTSSGAPAITRATPGSTCRSSTPTGVPGTTAAWWRISRACTSSASTSSTPSRPR